MINICHLVRTSKRSVRAEWRLNTILSSLSPANSTVITVKLPLRCLQEKKTNDINASNELNNLASKTDQSNFQRQLKIAHYIVIVKSTDFTVVLPKFDATL